jgi:hypothetical protein
MDRNQAKSSGARASGVGRHRWGKERRFAFIEFRLLWERRLNRKDLIDFFDISVPQASADLKEYMQFAPENIVYDASGKHYTPGERFSPIFISPDPESYLTELGLSDIDVAMVGDTFIGQAPRHSMLPSIHRRIKSDVLIDVLRAIRESLCLEVQYQSMSAAKASWRSISPHALGFDGHRWHVRAYCHKREGFRDFVIARMLDSRLGSVSNAKIQDDADWFTDTEIRIGPDPELSESQRKAIEWDYAMENGEARYTVKEAMAFYMLHKLGIRKNDGRSAIQRQVVLLNRDEYESLLTD